MDCLGTRLSRLARGLCAGAIACATPALALANEVVRLELVLAVDCSSSVNHEEFSLQMEGIAGAFEDPAVLAVLAQGSGDIAVSLMQWSSAGAQTRAIPWTRVGSEGEALAFAAQVRAVGRVVSGGATAIGNAIDAAAAWTLDNGFAGQRVVIDVSGDGRSNEGGSPAFARAAANRAGITINGLAILNEEPALGRYYVAGVVGGPGSFLLTADDFEDFAVAMRRKLYFEVVGPPVVEAPGLAAAGRPLLSRLWHAD